MYQQIFLTNVLRILDERGLTKKDLHDITGVARSYITDVTTGDGNPSLKTMEAIAKGLNVPLPMLLEHSDLPADEHEPHWQKHLLPPGFQRVWAILTDHQAFQVKKWESSAKALISKETKDKGDFSG